jgi:hypothetical protein
MLKVFCRLQATVAPLVSLAMVCCLGTSVSAWPPWRKRPVVNRAEKCGCVADYADKLDRPLLAAARVMTGAIIRYDCSADCASVYVLERDRFRCRGCGKRSALTVQPGEFAGHLGSLKCW